MLFTVRIAANTERTASEREQACPNGRVDDTSRRNFSTRSVQRRFSLHGGGLRDVRRARMRIRARRLSDPTGRSYAIGSSVETTFTHGVGGNDSFGRSMSPSHSTRLRHITTLLAHDSYPPSPSHRQTQPLSWIAASGGLRPSDLLRPVSPSKPTTPPLVTARPSRGLRRSTP